MTDIALDDLGARIEHHLGQAGLALDVLVECRVVTQLVCPVSRLIQEDAVESVMSGIEVNVGLHQINVAIAIVGRDIADHLHPSGA